MSISDTDVRQKAIKTAFVYLVAAIFCALFGAVYEAFSHEVYSYHMLYAFAFPLAGGVLPFSAMALGYLKKYPFPLARTLYHCGIATLTVGSVLCGVLYIYGTTNRLTAVYWIIGGLLTFGGITAYLLPSKE